MFITDSVHSSKFVTSAKEDM